MLRHCGRLLRYREGQTPQARVNRPRHGRGHEVRSRAPLCESHLSPTCGASLMYSRWVKYPTIVPGNS